MHGVVRQDAEEGPVMRPRAEANRPIGELIDVVGIPLGVRPARRLAGEDHLVETLRLRIHRGEVRGEQRDESNAAEGGGPDPGAGIPPGGRPPTSGRPAPSPVPRIPPRAKAWSAWTTW